MLTDWRNFASERPYTQAWTTLRVRLNSQQFAPETLADALDKLTPAGLTKWRDKALAKVGVRGLLHGNAESKRVKSLSNSLRQRLSLANIERTEPAVAPVTKVTREILNVDHNDSATVLYVQGDNTSHAEQARFGLLAQLLRSPFFTALRTEQQLGYVVAAANGRIHKTPGMAFIVQSPVASSQAVKVATREFIAGYRDELKAMPAIDFAAAKGGFLNELRERDKNQHGRALRYWGDLLFDIESFDGRELIATEVEKLDQTAMIRAVELVGERLDNAYFEVSSPGKFTTP